MAPDRHRPPAGPDLNVHEVMVRADRSALPGTLTLPTAARGLVLFAHGSGSSRLSPRNRLVADVLHRGGLATLLFDLLTAEEHAIDRSTAEFRFDIPRLAARLSQTVDWVAGESITRELPIGLFGASTGAAAALVTAAMRPAQVRAVVSRGGRPDLAGDKLPNVCAPTLLIVGELDTAVLALNYRAARALTVDYALEIIPGATHLFEEAGTLEQVAGLAQRWFRRHLSGAAAAGAAPREHP